MNFEYYAIGEITETRLGLGVWYGGGGGGSNNKKDHAAGKNLRCPLSFLFFFVLFQNTFKIDVFVSNLVKNVSSKKNKKDHDFRIF